MSASVVAVLKTSPATVIGDYRRLMELADYQDFLARDAATLIKLNLSWTKYFPACSTQPWQLEGVLRTLLADDYAAEDLLPVENRTVVTDPREGCENNLWGRVLRYYGLPFIPLTEVEWEVRKFESPLLKLPEIFPDGIEVPVTFEGKNVLHLPTVKTHGHSVTTGAIKNAFGGLLKEVRHYAHKHIHEVLVDLMYIQKELHRGVFAVMDGSVCGDGAGPRTMVPRIKNFILASGDSVAIDAVAARLMGFDPMEVPYLRMCHERELGCADCSKIRVVGEDVSGVNFGFKTRRSFVIWGDQMLRRGPLRFMERIALHSPAVMWAPAASNVYHDLMWYPTIGRKRIREFSASGWGRLFESYRRPVLASGTTSGGSRGQTDAVAAVAEHGR
ncbi:MAG: DUF362 domain-containing protein [Candidatus Binatia bacterium]